MTALPITQPATPNSREARMLVLFLIMLIFSFSPSKVLGQFGPLVFFGGSIFFVQVRPRFHIAKYAVVLLLYGIGACLYYFILPEFSFINYSFFCVTASSALVLFYDFKSVVSASLMRRISDLIKIFLLVEAIYGILQGAVGILRTGTPDFATGDFVRGTIELGFEPTGLGGNPIFAILISTQLFFVFATSASSTTMRRLVFYLVILTAWLLASVLHSIIYFISAMILATLLYTLRTRRKSLSILSWRVRTGVVGAGIFMAISAMLLLPSNVATLPYFFVNNLMIQEDSPSEKARAVFNTLFLLPQQIPIQPLLGVGFGQYSSRASLILTGEYLRGSSVPLPTYTSTVTEAYIISLYRSFLVNHPTGSSSLQPFFSWLSLYGEAGILGLVIVAIITLRAVSIFTKLTSDEFPKLGLLMLMMLLYVLLLGFQDNYWEFTQAIFPAFLLLKISYDFLMKYGNRPAIRQGYSRV